ncbi:hypothetical protein [Xanthomonas hortorum]|uniref:hypothetical protein n=1 Tax=Xanthomonas hortorum TaxID=56454 RepID=UPI001E31C533|nr:hypothetical protein [Xanthomonas hortorum]
MTMFGKELAVTNWRMAVSEQARSASSSHGWAGLGRLLVQLTVTNPFALGRGPRITSWMNAQPGRNALTTIANAVQKNKRIEVLP